MLTVRVIGIKGLRIELVGPNFGDQFENNNVHLDSGTQLVLRTGGVRSSEHE
jgi:hypothetical protein